MNAPFRFGAAGAPWFVNPNAPNVTARNARHPNAPNVARKARHPNAAAVAITEGSSSF
jgi:hypothetical protein